MNHSFGAWCLCSREISNRIIRIVYVICFVVTWMTRLREFDLIVIEEENVFFNRSLKYFEMKISLGIFHTRNRYRRFKHGLQTTKQDTIERGGSWCSIGSKWFSSPPSSALVLDLVFFLTVINNEKHANCDDFRLKNVTYVI